MQPPNTKLNQITETKKENKANTKTNNILNKAINSRMMHNIHHNNILNNLGIHPSNKVGISREHNTASTINSIRVGVISNKIGIIINKTTREDTSIASINNSRRTINSINNINSLVVYTLARLVKLGRITARHQFPRGLDQQNRRIYLRK